MDKTLPKTIQMSTVAGMITFMTAMFVGLFMRIIFAKQYLAASIESQNSQNYLLRSRIVGVIAIAIGLSTFLATFYYEKEISLLAMLGGILFIVLGLQYIFSSSGGATLGQWVLKGRLTNNTSNQSLQSDASKTRR